MSGPSQEVGLGRLQTLSAAELRDAWRDWMGSASPPILTARLMRHALAFKLQSQGQRAEVKKAEKSWALVIKRRGQDKTAAPVAICRAVAAPGTRILKDWGGTSHEVLVQEDGVLWNAQRYSSLSAVARAMTGTPRNGPRFFGLREATPR